MTFGEYYERLRAEYMRVDWSNRESIKAYNEYKRNLRKDLETSMISGNEVPYAYKEHYVENSWTSKK